MSQDISRTGSDHERAISVIECLRSTHPDPQLLGFLDDLQTYLDQHPENVVSVLIRLRNFVNTME
jgi:hypothetical protein